MTKPAARGGKKDEQSRREVDEASLAGERMGNNRLHGNDQRNVRNQRPLRPR
jgi:hypothetical protein